MRKQLQKIRLERLTEKPITRDAGYTFVEVLCFFAVAGLISLALLTFGIFARQIIENFQTIDRCIQALLECVSI